jgi:hypothetical protein
MLGTIRLSVVMLSVADPIVAAPGGIDIYYF